MGKSLKTIMQPDLYFATLDITNQKCVSIYRVLAGPQKHVLKINLLTGHFVKKKNQPMANVPERARILGINIIIINKLKKNTQKKPTLISGSDLSF